MILILMDADQILVFRKKPICERPSNPHAQLRSDRLILVETDNIVGIHPAGILFPQALFKKEGPVYLIRDDSFMLIRSGHFSIPFLYLVASQNIGDHIPHCSMGLPRLINNLIDCHIFSHSSLNAMTSSRICVSSLTAGRMLNPFAVRAI